MACMLLVSGSHMAWLTFVPVQYKAADWMGGQYTADPSLLNKLATVCFPVSFVFGFVGAYLFDTLGSYVPLMLGGWTLTPAMALRVVAVYIEDPDTRFWVIFAAQALTGVSLSMLSLSPTKIAAVWFAEDQRTLANTLITLMLPGGILFTYVISPLIVDSFAKDEFELTDGEGKFDSSFEALMWIYFIWNAIGTLLITVFMRYPGTPPLPASPSSLEKVLPFWQGIWRCLTNPMYIMLCATMSCGLGVISILMVSLPTVLCPWGYDDKWANSWGIVILITSGTISSTIFAIVVDRVGHMVTFMRVLMVGVLIGFIMFIWFATTEPNYVAFGFATAFLGIFAYPTLPMAYELSVETTYPVGPATSAGLNWIISSLASFLMEFIYVPLAKDMPESHDSELYPNKCVVDGDGDGEVTDQDYRISLYAITSLTAIVALVWFVFYRCPYNRRSLDDSTRKEQLELQTGSVNEGFSKSE